VDKDAMYVSGVQHKNMIKIEFQQLEMRRPGKMDLLSKMK